MNAATWKDLPKNERIELLERCGSAVVPNVREHQGAKWTDIPRQVRDRIQAIE